MSLLENIEIELFALMRYVEIFSKIDLAFHGKYLSSQEIIRICRFRRPDNGWDKVAPA